ncbi:S8 family serine peptidase [Clostridium cibarium]|uniref:S8 family serine peptidase n=1 Tax=Clostridium cibarium TaxID=2762247 RepID=A0ABR8PWT4_9CLOT|nr:S8 family serine peptidase [Clostridium cibarium]MBD7912578.1 S8 family serine peptidase [Clostridium cibarium]
MISKKLKLAIIDDGININRYSIGELEYDVEVTYNLKIRKVNSIDSFDSSHGTTCAAIIKKIAPNANLSSVKIINNETYKSTAAQLVKSIEWCVDKKIDIVNLSLGTIDYRDFEPIREVVNYATKNGLIIVAAGNNNVGYTCPASLSNVIGVKCDINSKISLDECEYAYDLYSPDGIEINAHSIDEITNYKGEVKKILKCNSFATPFITASVYNIMCRQINNNIVNVKRELMKRAVNFALGRDNYFFSKNIDWIDKAILFSANKEDENIISSYCNIVEKVNLKGIDIKDKLRNLIRYIKYNITMMKVIDTIIILMEHYSITKFQEDIFKLIAYLNCYGKNLIIIDNGENELELSKLKNTIGTKIWHQSLYKNIKRKISNNKNSPLIVIYDFVGNLSSIVAIGLKKLFQANGYYCVAGTNEVKGIIYGLEYVPVDRLGMITNNIYNEDIYIYCVNNLRCEVDLQPDVTVIIESEKSIIELDVSIALNENIIFVNENVDLNKLYNDIFNLFEE